MNGRECGTVIDFYRGHKVCIQWLIKTTTLHYRQIIHKRKQQNQSSKTFMASIKVFLEKISGSENELLIICRCIEIRKGTKSWARKGELCHRESHGYYTINPCLVAIIPIGISFLGLSLGVLWALSIHNMPRKSLYLGRIILYINTN